MKMTYKLVNGEEITVEQPVEVVTLTGTTTPAIIGSSDKGDGYEIIIKEE